MKFNLITMFSFIFLSVARVNANEYSAENHVGATSFIAISSALIEKVVTSPALLKDIKGNKILIIGQNGAKYFARFSGVTTAALAGFGVGKLIVKADKSGYIVDTTGKILTPVFFVIRKGNEFILERRSNNIENSEKDVDYYDEHIIDLYDYEYFGEGK